MKYKLHIFIADIEAENEAEARKKAYSLLEDYAGSNDGSELLANATAILTLEDET